VTANKQCSVLRGTSDNQLANFKKQTKMTVKVEDVDGKIPKIDTVIIQNGKGSAKSYASDTAKPTVVPSK
jgi:hypothetical protein